MQTARLRTVDGYEIDAVVTHAESSDVVVWMHGISVNKDEYLGFFLDGAQWLVTRGITSIRFDFRGHGKSSGSSLEFSIVAQNLDVRAVLEFAQRQFRARTDPPSRNELWRASSYICGREILRCR